MSHTKEQLLIELMAEAADQVLAGASASACLDAHPEQAAALEPLLSAVQEVHNLRAVPPRSAEVAAQSRAQFLAAAYAPRKAEKRPQGPIAQLTAWWRALRDWGAGLLGAGGMPRTLPVGLAAALAVVLLSGLLLTGIVSASAESLPGDLLYPIKTATERVQVFFTTDAAERAKLLAEIEARRVQEAQTIVESGRAIANVPLQGIIDAITGSTWRVSGLTVTITADSQIIGTPEVGGRVQGQAYAPGDGTLVVRYVEIDPPDRPQRPASTPAPTLAQPVPTATPSATATITGTAQPMYSSARGAEPLAPYIDATETSTPEPTATPTRTTTPTATRTRTVTPTATASATLAPPRDIVKARIIGRVDQIGATAWTIAGRTVAINADTTFSGNPVVGSLVEAIVEIKPNGALIALSITEIAGPERTPEPLEFTGRLQSINGAVWSIEGIQVIVTGDTVLENNPAIGDVVSVKAERRADGEVRALRITAIRSVVVNFSGVIETMGGDTWRIGGQLVRITGETQIIGDATVGAFVQVEAQQLTDGSLVAQIIVVIAPAATPTPTVTWTPTSTATATTEPTATSTPQEEAPSAVTWMLTPEDTPGP